MVTDEIALHPMGAIIIVDMTLAATKNNRGHDNI